MKDEWVESCLSLAHVPGFYSGARKIIRGQSLVFNDFSNDLHIKDCGFTQSKLTALRRLYLHQESVDAAVTQWERCLSRKKYSSASFHCYNHYLKSDPTKKSKRASVMGPCIQAVSLTLLNDKSVAVDAFYRTTELFKKFPADLIFIRDTLLPQFRIDTLREVRFHFANITCHPMYFVTLIPHLSNPIKHLKELKKTDQRFFEWTVKWTARYVCKEYGRGIEKFSQALRVRKDALERIPERVMPKLQQYLRDNHPGYRGDK